MTKTLEPQTEYQPAWEIAHLFPYQGLWSESEYITLTDATNRLVEFSNGKIEVLPMPTRTHQNLIFLLAKIFDQILSASNLGNVYVAALRVRLWENKIREPDIVVMLAEHRDREHESYFDGADLVVEIVSADDPNRDLVVKRAEYAQAGIPEYWIVDPRDETVTVLQLQDADYLEHGRFERGATASSVLLAGVSVDVAQLFDAART